MFGHQKPAPDFEYFTIYDTKGGMYREPMLAINRHVLLRQMESDIYRNPQQKLNVLVTNAEDFQVFKIAEYDKKLGAITPCKHEHVANLHELKSSVERRAQQDKPEIGH